MTAEELLAAAEHCTLCGKEHPVRAGRDFRGQPFSTDATDHTRLPLDPLVAMRLRKLIPVTVTQRRPPRTRLAGEKGR